MKISAIVMSRVLAFIDAADLSPRGAVVAQDFVRDIAKQFHFMKSPQTLEEFDQSKGIEFLSGRVGKRAVSKFVIWNNILVIEARSNTTECKQMLQQILEWATDKFGLTYNPEMIRRYGYVSDLSFYSDAPILTLSPVLERIGQRTGAALSEIWQEPVHYEAVDIKIGHDPLSRKWGIAPFQITRRAEHKFEENKYYSEAPLPTDLHIELLEEFERGVLESLGKVRTAQ